MDDKELMQFAAAAAGINLLDWRDDWRNDNGDYVGKSWRTTSRELWNPLSDDGDALQLAVRLQLNVEYSQRRSGAIVISGMDSSAPVETFQANDKLDPPLAVRRAIVRAAAEIGKAR